MPRFDLAIVGSGYGGSALAARLAPHHRTLIIERGRRWRTEELPRGVVDLARLYMRAGAAGRGLWEMRLGRGVGNAVVSAFGGSSIVNYGISIRPEPHVFDDWPVGAEDLAPHYQRALEILRPSPNPLAQGLRDRAFLDRVEPGRRRDLENTIDWASCRNCGECPLGCRHGAKRSLDRTYLAAAEAPGAEVRAETTLVGFERDGEGFRLTLRTTGERDAPPRELWARRLVLAAGTFGTLDLLQRHRDRFPLSPAFGARMSMNGDGLAFLYNTPYPIDSVSGAPISTCALLPFADPAGRRRTLMVMSGRVPATAMTFSALVLGTLAEFLGRNRGPIDPPGARARRRLRDLLERSPEGAFSHTFMYKLDAQDSASGRLGFDARGRAALDWPDYARDPIVRFAARRLEAWADAVGGRLVRDLGTFPGMRSLRGRRTRRSVSGS
jgi:2-polyprenyl-6-methoxyphenol hydroxylase-like FAD-dependent oxidoreductase